VPLCELGLDGAQTSCETVNAYLAAHAAVRKDHGGGSVQTETAWGDGERMVKKGSWAEYFNAAAGRCDASMSTIGTQSWDGTTAEMRICRVGDDVQGLIRLPGQAWKLVDWHVRADLPETLATGPIAYAGTAVPDMRVSADYVHYNVRGLAGRLHEGGLRVEPSHAQHNATIAAATAATMNSPRLTNATRVVCWGHRFAPTIATTGPSPPATRNV